MPETATLNVRMDADTKREFSAFCDEIGMSASSLMNVFARTVVRNKEVPFPMTTRAVINMPTCYRTLFPQSDAELFDSIDAAASVPAADCVCTESGVGAIRERLGW